MSKPRRVLCLSLILTVIPVLAGSTGAQTTLHPKAQELKRIYEQQGEVAYLRALYRMQGPPPRLPYPLRDRWYRDLENAPITPTGRRPSQAFWERLSAIYSGRVPGGGSSSVIQGPPSARGTDFLPPYACEWLGIWTSRSVAEKQQYLKEIALYASQLAKSGINVVRIFYYFQAWKWWQIKRGEGGEIFGVQLDEVMDILAWHGIQANVVLGNTFGDEPLVPVIEAICYRDYWGPDPSLPPQEKLVIRDGEMWKPGSAHVWQGPGARTLRIPVAFASFRTNEWGPYVTQVANWCIGKPSLRNYILFNEPEGASPILANVQRQVAQLIEDARLAILAVHGSTFNQFMISASGHIPLETFDTAHLSAVANCGPPGEPCYIKTYVPTVGFHPTTVHMYSGGQYPATPAMGQYAALTWPPAFQQFSIQGLRTNVASGTGSPVAGALEEAQAYHVLNNTIGDIEELHIWHFTPQYYHDVDLAIRGTPVDRTRGRMVFNSVNQALHYNGIHLIDGTPISSRDAVSFQGRYNVPVSYPFVTDSLIKPEHTAFFGTNRVVNAPTPAFPSNAMRLSVARGGDATHTTTLAILADLFDDQPTNHHHAETSFSPRVDRHRIWLTARREQGSTVYVPVPGDLIALDAMIPSSELTKLSRELAFADLDDNSPPPLLPLPLRMMTLAPFMDRWFRVGDPANPTGKSEFDATFGGLGTMGSPIPLFGPCTWTGYDTTAKYNFPERQVMLRGQIVRRLWKGLPGISGKIAATFIGSSSDTEGSYDDFLIAYHRTVRREINQSEHYGVGQQARDATLPGTLSWSANYADVFRNDPVGAPDPPSLRALKHEIVTVKVTCWLKTDNSFVIVALAPEVLETRGDHTDLVTTPGAEAVDPVLVSNRTGDAILVYCSRQDSYFQFAAAQDSSSPHSGTIGAEFTDPSSCGSPFNPITFTNIIAINWPLFHQQSHWRVYDWRLKARFRAPGSTGWSLPFDLSEPIYPQGPMEPAFRMENRTTWTTDLQDLERRDDRLRAYEHGSAVLAFHEGWDPTSYGVKIEPADPHTYHHSVDPSVLLGERQGGTNELQVVIGWKQMPKLIRENWFDWHTTGQPNCTPPAAIQRPPAYALRALRLKVPDYTAGVPSLALNQPAAYRNFGTDSYVVTTPGQSSQSAFGTWGFVWSPTTADLTGEDRSRAYVQMGEDLYRMYEADTGTTTLQTLAPLGPARAAARMPRAGVAPRQTIPGFSGDSTLELAAWIRPHPVTPGKFQIGYAWSAPQIAAVGDKGPFVLRLPSSSTEYETTDPKADIAGCVAFVDFNNGVPTGRIVWKADDDVRWAKVEYDVNQAKTLSLQNASVSPAFGTLATEVSVTQDGIFWTYAGSLMAVRPQ